MKVIQSQRNIHLIHFFLHTDVVTCQKKRYKGTDEPKTKRARLELELLEAEKEVALLKAKNLKQEHEILKLRYDVLLLQKQVLNNVFCNNR